MKPWNLIFDIESILTPIAIERVRIKNRMYRVVYVFGIRVASMNIAK